jgi:hypothetical protein
MFYFRNPLRISFKKAIFLIPIIIIIFYYISSLLYINLSENEYYKNSLENQAYDTVVFLDYNSGDNIYRSLNGNVRPQKDTQFINVGLYMALPNKNYHLSPFKDINLMSNEIIIPTHTAKKYHLNLGDTIDLIHNNNIYTYTIVEIMPTTYDFDKTSNREGISIIAYNETFNQSENVKYLVYSTSDQIFFNIVEPLIIITSIINEINIENIWILLQLIITIILIYLIIEVILDESRVHDYKMLLYYGLRKTKVFIWINVDIYFRYFIFSFLGLFIFYIFNQTSFYSQFLIIVFIHLLITIISTLIFSFIYLGKVLIK